MTVPASNTPAASSRRRTLRWLAPVVAAGVVATGIAVPRLADASSALEKLPDLTAAQLLADVSTAEVDGLSGTVVATSRLGLPALPTGAGGGGGAVSLPGLLAGSTTARVWSAGQDKQRIAVDAAFAEYDIVRDGTDAYTYDSASSDVTHLTLPKREDGTTEPVPGAVTPESAAGQALSMITPSTEVTVGTSALVADRAAYELVLRPKDAGTLVDTVRLAVDGQTKVPLRMQVFGKGQSEPAVEIGFTSVRFAVPDASVFAFTPPAGSMVKEKDLGALGSDMTKDVTKDPAYRPGLKAPDATDPAGQPSVLGKDWTSVVVLPNVELPESASVLVEQLSKPVQGGRVVTSALVSVLLADDGRVLIGAVPAERLVQLAAT